MNLKCHKEIFTGMSLSDGCLRKGLPLPEFCPLIKVTEKITNYSLHSTFDMLTKKLNVCYTTELSLEFVDTRNEIANE